MAHLIIFTSFQDTLIQKQQINKSCCICSISLYVFGLVSNESVAGPKHENNSWLIYKNFTLNRTKEQDIQSYWLQLLKSARRQNTVVDQCGSSTAQWLEPGCVPGVSGGKNTGGGGGGGAAGPVRLVFATNCYCKHSLLTQGQPALPAPNTTTTQHRISVEERRGRLGKNSGEQ